MPSRHKLKKASSTGSSLSECSKELRELPEKDYNELLASVAGLPKKIHVSEIDGLLPGSGADEPVCGREHGSLTPAAKSCLQKIMCEIRESGLDDLKTGLYTKSDDAVMSSKKNDVFSGLKSTRKKPVGYENEEMKFIDEDNFSDVEMMDLTGTNVPKHTFTRGNREQTATEYMDDDVEAGTLKVVEGARHGFCDEWNEKSLLRNGRLLTRNQTILGPQCDGLFYPITEFVTGTDLIPSLTPAYEMPPLSKSLLPTPTTESDDMSSTGVNALQTNQQNGVTSNIEDVITKSAIQDITPNSKTELGKRKKGKKEKKENVFMAENVPGHMGQLSVEQLVHLIEGSNSEQNVKKQSHKDKSSASVEVVCEEAGQTKKERRRKSKETKENTTPTSAPVTIGAQQTKTGGSAAAAAATSVTSTSVTASPPTSGANAHSPKILAGNEAPFPDQEKQTGRGSDERSARCLTEDGEEEYLSADEGVASPVGDETYLPPNIMNSSTTVASVSTVSSTSEVVLDGRNYRADDEDVTQIERQCADEQEFITVNTKKKKLIESAGKQQQQRTGSAGKDERHQRVLERLEPNRRSSLGVAPEMRSAPSSNSALQYGRRPTTASLADFLDEKDGGKVLSKSVVSGSAKNMRKPPHRNERIAQADVEVSIPDPPPKQMSKPTQSTTSDSPERTFSYADAAKKSSEPSRDNSPACVTAASPSSKSESPASKPPTPVLCARTETSDTEVLPCANVPAGVSGPADGLSFFYDETEATQFEETPYDAGNGTTSDRTFVLNLGGKTVRFAKGMASSAVDVAPSNSHHMCMVEMLAQRWKMFQEGNVPKIYQPRIISS